MKQFRDILSEPKSQAHRAGWAKAQANTARNTAMRGSDALTVRLAGTYSGMTIAEVSALRDTSVTRCVMGQEVVGSVPSGWQGL